MAERFEVLRMKIIQTIPLLLHKEESAENEATAVSYSDIATVVLPEHSFCLKTSFAITSEGFETVGKIQIELKHIAGEEQVSLELTNPGNVPFRDGFRNIEGTFEIVKEEDAILSTRILIADVTTCNDFECTCDRKQLCFRIMTFCRVADIIKCIVETEVGNAGIIAKFLGRISSYGKNGSATGSVQGIPSFPLNYTADILSDFLIRVAGKELPVHKAILAGQSDIFLGMFTVRSNETKKGVMEWKESTLEGVKALLNFLYKRELTIPNKENMNIVYEMLHTAEKYNIQSLRESLVEVLCLLVPSEEFDLDNAIQFFIFAQRLKSRLLENKAFQIFQIKRAEIRNSKSVTAFFKENTELAEKFLTQCLN